jgi:hypothetical protein
MDTTEQRLTHLILLLLAELLDHSTEFRIGKVLKGVRTNVCNQPARRGDHVDPGQEEDDCLDS